MSVINAVAEFERDLLIRAHPCGPVPAKEQGKVLGRPRSLTDAQKQMSVEVGEGASVSKLFTRLCVSRQTIQPGAG